MMAVCEQCGAHFEAKRSTARFCSQRCRTRAHRAMRAIEPEAGPSFKASSASVEEAARVVLALKSDAGACERLSHSAPLQLRASFARTAVAVRKALEAEDLW